MHKETIKLLQRTPPNLLHPVFDLQGDLLTYGFRVEQPDPKKTTRTKPKANHIVSVAGDVYQAARHAGDVDGLRRTLLEVRQRAEPQLAAPSVDVAQQILVAAQRRDRECRLLPATGHRERGDGHRSGL